MHAFDVNIFEKFEQRGRSRTGLKLRHNSPGQRKSWQGLVKRRDHGAPLDISPEAGFPSGGASQILTVKSMDPVASFRPSGLKARPRTPALCPRNVQASRPRAVSQSLTVLSLLAEA